MMLKKRQYQIVVSQLTGSPLEVFNPIPTCVLKGLGDGPVDYIVLD